MHREDHRLARNQNDWREVPHDVERLLCVDQSRAQVYGAADQQRVAVLWRPRHKIGSDGRRCAGPVLDYELLAEQAAPLVGHQTRDDVGRRGWNEAGNDTHRAVGIVALCLSRSDRARDNERS